MDMPRVDQGFRIFFVIAQKKFGDFIAPVMKSIMQRQITVYVSDVNRRSLAKPIFHLFFIFMNDSIVKACSANADLPSDEEPRIVMTICSKVSSGDRLPSGWLDYRINVV